MDFESLGGQHDGGETAAPAEMEHKPVASVPAPKKQRRGSTGTSAGKDLRTYFAASSDSMQPADLGTAGLSLEVVSGPCSAAPSELPVPAAEDAVLSAFKLQVSKWQEVPDVWLAPPAPPALAAPTHCSPGGLAEADAGPAGSHGSVGLEMAVFVGPAELGSLSEAVPLLVARAPLQPSGRAIFGRFPQRWLELTGRSDALGTRCLFAARRHEHSVFAPLPVEQLLRVPPAAREWQPPCDLSMQAPALREPEPAEGAWLVQAHPGLGAVRVLLRPGVLLLRMLGRGVALPSARFTWRITDASNEPLAAAPEVRPPATAVGEFSILSNVEDAAHTQPPHFVQFPLRREQLRSLGWMMRQEQCRRDPFVTELRESDAFCDAPHWKLEGQLRCEYHDVKGGVLADAIGYGKTACTIGLIDCTFGEMPPQVPDQWRGFIPTKATLVLAPTNLHAQWLSEVNKFVGKDQLKVVAVQTCAQLKRLSLRELMEADLVVATYRLFYSTPYLHRLQEVVRTQRPAFSFPKLPGGSQQAPGAAGRAAMARSPAEWARVYREAFEVLPQWAETLCTRRASGAATPPRQPMAAETAAQAAEAADMEPPTQPQAGRRRRSKAHIASQPSAVGSQETIAGTTDSEVVASAPSKRRRLQGKQAVAPSQQTAAEAGPHDAPHRETDTWASSTPYIPLEAFWWKRVVCDEFHELLSRYPPAQVAVELFKTEYKWGLSGTPPCQTLAQIRKAAGFFGVQIPKPAAQDDGEVPRQVAQEWLDAFVRRNTAEVPPLEEQESIVPVRQTPKERALYLALTRQQQVEQLTQRASMTACTQPSQSVLEEPPELQAARRDVTGLLKLCSHFNPSGAADVLSAADACSRQLALRREMVRSIKREIQNLADRAASTVQLVRHFEPHFCCPVDPRYYVGLRLASRADLAARLEFLGAPTTGTKAELLVRLVGKGKGKGAGRAEGANEAAKGAALQADFDPGFLRGALPEEPPVWLQLEADAHADEAAEPGVVARAVRSALERLEVGSVPTRCVRLRSHLGMPKWPKPEAPSAEAATASQPASEAEVLLEDWQWMCSRENAERLRRVTGAWKADIERSGRRLLELSGEAAARERSLQIFLESVGQAAATSSEEEPCTDFTKYGSKIAAIVKHVQTLQRQDATCKIICFVQWEDLKRKISSALDEFEVEHLTLQGSIWARRSALVHFQYEADGPRLLLLSLEESASGTNLTAANHVIIVHPMDAATAEEAVAFEMQAVGRVRRPGQQRKIHIWRFVTIDTIEQSITEEHQRELWERQRARVLVSQPDVAMSLLDSDMEEHDEDIDGAPVDDADMMKGATQLHCSPAAAQVPNVMFDAAASKCSASEDPSTQRYVGLGAAVEAESVCMVVDADATQRYAGGNPDTPGWAHWLGSVGA